MEKDETFKKYYVKYRSRLYWYVYRKISKEEEAQDITADAFLKLYENLDDLSGRGEKGVIAWLYTVARNQCIDHLRKQGTRKSRSMEDEEIETAAKVYNDFVLEAMEESEIQEMKVALETVDEVTREIMQLRYEEGLKFSEIGDIIGKSEGACKMILYRSLEALREEIMKSRQKEDVNEK